MIQNSAEINFGGLKIAAVHSNDHPNYEIIVSAAGTIFKGTPAQFEAMCESHELLREALRKFLDMQEELLNPFRINDTCSFAREALRRAD